MISSSAGDLQPVFQSMLDNATRICGAGYGTLFRVEYGEYEPVAHHDAPDALVKHLAEQGQSAEARVYDGTRHARRRMWSTSRTFGRTPTARATLR